MLLVLGTQTGTYITGFPGSPAFSLEHRLIVLLAFLVPQLKDSRYGTSKSPHLLANS